MKETPYGNHLANCGFGKTQVAFPLTLTLSLGERGQPGGRLGVRKVASANPAPVFARNQSVILPLPEGEGRGEGEGAIHRARDSRVQESPPPDPPSFRPQNLLNRYGQRV